MPGWYCTVPGVLSLARRPAISSRMTSSIFSPFILFVFEESWEAEGQRHPVSTALSRIYRDLGVLHRHQDTQENATTHLGTKSCQRSRGSAWARRFQLVPGGGESLTPTAHVSDFVTVFARARDVMSIAE
ncbi:hypothetical protein RRG08_065225 [Elysia crispata]|uniref:Uncharacterized protein n=1 Tax=Elysia crispata TaxID=231223 RepID=A0AAE0YHH6_9GAST|nr:hypothetical protein RRG08_065225 [Elysia crispata]